jgi:3-hydroxyisobutyrate dehydrogenase
MPTMPAHKPRIGIVGLGNMGAAMAATLAGKGLDVAGCDVSPARRALVAASVETPAGLSDCSVVLLSLPSSRDVEAVTRGLLPALPAGALVIDTSTADPASTRALQREAAAGGIGFVDAPVSGGASGAAAGTLLVMLGGAEADIARAEPVLAHLARKIVRCGGPGSGNVVKLVNNLLCAGHLLLAGEALRLAAAGGVAADDLLGALNAGSGRSAVSEVNLPRWVLPGTFDSGFTMALMAKDAGLAAGLAGAGPLARDVAAAWAAAARELGGGADFNRIVTRTPP